MHKRLIIIRGIPGSGKSTKAKEIIEQNKCKCEVTHHYEADMFFELDGEYKWNPNKIHLAHQWCRDRVFDALNFGHSCVVSNTFTTMKEMRPYIDFCVENKISFKVIRCSGKYNNVHNVPDDTIQKMQDRFEDCPGEVFL